MQIISDANSSPLRNRVSVAETKITTVLDEAFKDARSTTQQTIKTFEKIEQIGTYCRN